MKKLEYCLLFFLMLTLYSCVEEKSIKTETSTIRVGSKKDKVYEISHVNGNVLGIKTITYYPNGVPKKIIENFYESRHWHYRSDGTLKSKIHKKNNVRDGWSFWYYEDGRTLKEKSFWMDSLQYGEIYLYYKNGNLSHYYVTDIFIDTFYFSEWDSFGNIKIQDGISISNKFYTNDPINQIYINDTVMLCFTVATPPNTKSLFYRRNENFHYDTLVVINNTVCCNFFYKTPGLHRTYLMGELSDYNTNNFNKDSLVIELYVKHNHHSTP